MQITGAVLEELDPPGPREVLVEIAAAGVCHSDLSVVDGVAAKREGALDLGATSALDPTEPASAATAPGGRTVTVGLPPPDALASISPLQLVAEAHTVMGSYLGSAVPSRDIPVFAQWWREGRLLVDALVSSPISLDDINLAMDELTAGTTLRQVIEF